MEKEILDAINLQIYGKFPYLKGIHPDTSLHDNNSLLTYQGQSITANGHPIPLIVRVVTDSKGKILKISTSR
jgi:hypothetical protein